MDNRNAFNLKLKKIFSDFRKVEKPFGEPQDVYNMYIITARSKSYNLRNIPYRISFDKMNDFLH